MSYIEIEPMQYSSKQTRKIIYKRISRKALSKKVIEHLWEEANASLKPRVTEDSQAFCFQFRKDKPLLMISKVDGKIYAFKDTKFLKHQTGIFLRILNGYGLVEGFERKTVSKKEPKVEWRNRNGFENK